VRYSEAIRRTKKMSGSVGRGIGGSVLPVAEDVTVAEEYCPWVREQ
jgi:hypothetical protein